LLPLPGAEKLTAPTGGKAVLRDGNVTVTWNAVPGAKAYRVQRTSSLEPRPKALAMGLTTTRCIEPAPERGESLRYTIFAIIAAAARPVSRLGTRHRKDVSLSNTLGDI